MSVTLPLHLSHTYSLLLSSSLPLPLSFSPSITSFTLWVMIRKWITSEGGLGSQTGELETGRTKGRVATVKNSFLLFSLEQESGIKGAILHRDKTLFEKKKDPLLLIGCNSVWLGPSHFGFFPISRARTVVPPPCF